MSLRARLQRLEKTALTGRIAGGLSAEEIVRAGRWLEEARRRRLTAGEALSRGELVLEGISRDAIPAILEAYRELRKREVDHRQNCFEET